MLWSRRVQVPPAWSLTRVMPSAGQVDPSGDETAFLPLLDKTGHEEDITPT